MSDLMYLDKIASSAYEECVVLMIRRGIKDIPQDLPKRGKYYRDLFDRSVKSKKMSDIFKANFSLFVSKFSDTEASLLRSW